MLLQNMICKIQKSKTIKLSSLFYLALAFYIIDNNIRYSYIYNIWSLNNNKMLLFIKFIRYMVYFLCFIRIILITKSSKYRLLFVIFSFFIVILAAITGPEKTPIFQALLIVSAIDLDFDKVINIFFRIQLLFFICNILLSVLGMFDTIYVFDNGRIRYYLGYGWVNRASYCWLFMALEYIYLKKFKINLNFIAVFLVGALILYQLTQTNFSFFLSLVLAFCCFFKFLNNCLTRTIKWKENTKRRTRIYIVSFILFVMIGFLLPYLYNSRNPIWHGLNLILNSRLVLGQKALNLYGIGLFGHKVKWVGSSTLLFGLSESKQYFTVDCDYLRLTIEYGILYLIWILYMYMMGLIRSCQIKRFDISFCILFIGIICIFEPRLIDFGFNPFILFSICNFSETKIKNNNNEKIIVKKNLKIKVS